MTEQETAERIAALEQARAQIEIALGGNADWLSFRQAAPGSSRLLAERALAGNPLYRSWDLLNEAIQDLQARGARQAGGDDLTRIRGIGPALAQRLAELGTTTFAQIAAWRPEDVRDVAEALELGRKISSQNWIEQAALLDLRRRVGATETAQPGSGADAGSADDNARHAGRAVARSIELDDVLRNIRNDAALRGLPSVGLDVGPQVAPTGGEASAALRRHEQAPEPADGAHALDGADTVAFEPEEATVTFVIRDRPGLPSEHERGPRPSNSAARSARDMPRAPAEDQGAEAQVEIVAKDRASRAASPKR